MCMCVCMRVCVKTDAGCVGYQTWGGGVQMLVAWESLTLPLPEAFLRPPGRAGLLCPQSSMPLPGCVFLVMTVPQGSVPNAAKLSRWLSCCPEVHRGGGRGCPLFPNELPQLISAPLWPSLSLPPLTRNLNGTGWQA